MTSPDPSSVRFPGPWEHLDVRANGIRLHAVEYRPEGSDPDPDRRLVVLLHGFGGFWWSWRHLLPQLHDAGYRAVAFDLRGYGDSDKPPRGYDGWTLSGDVAGLVRALGHTSAAVVGHGEGGLGCWAAATLHPRVVSAIAVISSPHPIALKRSALRNKEQRSAMLGPITFAQLPRVAEDRLTRDDGAEIGAVYAARSGATWRRTADYAEALPRYRSAIQIPGTAHSALEYARWAWRSQFRPDGARFLSSMNQRLHIPVLAFRGDVDPYVLPQPVYSSHDWATDYRVRVVENAGHYAHEEAPGTVGPQLVDFLASLPGPRLLP
ncbi:alpha/beta fold hydrolase [Tsukamurella paurometabola]|uniref:Soluble epoxide hydrolase n=1 Tax=Tsukamurella paurometabola TaxID=2061 RepID=A0A3P8K1B7_TSUPA|nr:alpha/beta hydrolase [Tsukamurella paurometabola]UEA81828.1 alpha/beta hydrolase [Tsukamurella paurometabola]VDR38844.1 Soluble epoxide hydrolase [Tsukamurella paurometabola]